MNASPRHFFRPRAGSSCGIRSPQLPLRNSQPTHVGCFPLEPYSRPFTSIRGSSPRVRLLVYSAVNPTAWWSTTMTIWWNSLPTLRIPDTVLDVSSFLE